MSNAFVSNVFENSKLTNLSAKPFIIPPPSLSDQLKLPHMKFQDRLDLPLNWIYNCGKVRDAKSRYDLHLFKNTEIAFLLIINGIPSI